MMKESDKLESRESRTSEDQQIIADLRSEVMQMRASAVAPNLNQKSWSQD